MDREAGTPRLSAITEPSAEGAAPEAQTPGRVALPTHPGELQEKAHFLQLYPDG